MVTFAWKLKSLQSLDKQNIESRERRTCYGIYRKRKCRWNSWQCKEISWKWLQMLTWSEGWPCSSQFRGEEVMANLNNCLELSTKELDLVILANIQAVTRFENIGEKRSRSPRCNFLFQSKPICQEMFLMLYGLSYSRFCRLKEHYESNGLSSRTHGNTKQLPLNTLSRAVVEDVNGFLSNYVEDHTVSLPGRILGYKDKYAALEYQTSKWNVQKLEPMGTSSFHSSLIWTFWVLLITF